MNEAPAKYHPPQCTCPPATEQTCHNHACPRNYERVMQELNDDRLVHRALMTLVIVVPLLALAFWMVIWIGP